MPDDVTVLQREISDLRFQLSQKTHEADLLRAELGDLRPRVSNQEHTIARLRATLNHAAPTAEPLPTDAEPASTDRFHNGG